MDPFIAEIILFAGNFAPRGWALCDGHLLPINQNQALFLLLGTYYGGDGKTTFALPDLRGRVPVSQGGGPGLSNYNLGEKGGTERNTITVGQMPAHNHVVTVPTSTEAGGESTGPLDASLIYAEEANATYSGATASHNGGGQSVNNVQPYLALNYIISLQGTFPSRT